MLDFRYHALSLVAVFLALGIGIVLGVTIGDSLVSETERNLRGSLREDVVDARERASDAQADLRGRDRVLGAAAPLVVDARLRGKEVALVGIGSLPLDVQAAAQETVKSGGGRVVSVAFLDVPGQLGELGEAAGGRFAAIGRDPRLARRFGERLGRSLLAGRGLAARLGRALPERFRGEYAGADAVVLWRAAPGEPKEGDSADDARRDAREAIEDGLLAAIRARGAPAAGIEKSSTDPSQVAFYAERDIASVDSVDLAAGRIALVLALTEQVTGSFGVKGSADAPLPPVRRVAGAR